jgi:hypothetical protein
MSGAAGIPAVHGGEEVNATVMSSRLPAVDADVLAARPSEDTRLFRAARAFFDTACLVYSVWKRPVRADCGKLSAVGRGEDEEAK